MSEAARPVAWLTTWGIVTTENPRYAAAHPATITLSTPEASLSLARNEALRDAARKVQEYVGGEHEAQGRAASAILDDIQDMMGKRAQPQSERGRQNDARAQIRHSTG